MSDILRPLIGIAAERPLTRAEAEAAFGALFEGAATPAQMGGFLMALRTRGETVDEYAAAASVMRSKCNAVKAPAGAMDIVGTGGDGKGTLNISTATAFVVAGAGVRCLSEVGIGFMMAPMHHPAMRHVGPVRMELGTRTIFNILGPLTNPAGAKRQLTGAFTARLIRPMAETLLALGSEKAWLVHGGDGTDELSIAAKSKVAALEGGTIREFDIGPEDAGLPYHPFESLLGGTPAENAVALRALLDGAQGAYRDAVLFNAAAALVVAEKATTLHEGVDLARQSIDSGAAKAKVHALARITTAG